MCGGRGVLKRVKKRDESTGTGRDMKERVQRIEVRDERYNKVRGRERGRRKVRKGDIWE